MTTLPQEMLHAYAILERYKTIHDQIFKFSWRKVIPISGLFKPIDYGLHLSDLTFLNLLLRTDRRVTKPALRVAKRFSPVC